MNLQKIDITVQQPERFVAPPEPESWGCLFEIKHDPAGAKYGLRATEIDGEISYRNLASLRFGASGITFHTGKDLLEPGVRVIIAVGPEGKTPTCTLYEISS